MPPTPKTPSSAQNGNSTNAGEIHMAKYEDLGANLNLRQMEDRSEALRLTTAAGLTLHIAFVADGIGGSGFGQTASQIALDTVLAVLKQSQQTDIGTLLKDALLQAHDQVRRRAGENPTLRTMGTTATLAAIYQNKLYVAHVGDSRAYLIRDDQIMQLTLDHTWGNEMILQKKFSPEEVAKHSKREELARYLGQPPHVPLVVDVGVRAIQPNSDAPPTNAEIKSAGYPLLPGDVVLVCSDGLIKERQRVAGHYVEPAEILADVQRYHTQPEKLSNVLVSRAVGREVDDNVSVAVLELPGGKPNPLAALALPAMPANWLPYAFGALTLLVVFILLGVLLTNGGTREPNPAPMQPIPTQQAQSLPSATARPADGSARVLELNGVLNFNGDLLAAAINDSLPLQVNDRFSAAPGARLLLDFGNGTYLALNSDSEVRIVAMQPLRISIARGQVLLAGVQIAAEADARTFRAEGSDAVLGLTFEPAAGNLWVDCLRGACTLSEGAALNGGLRGGWNGGLALNAPEPARYDVWLALAPNLVPLPTETPTPTATLTPTETPTPTPTLRAAIVTPQPGETKRPGRPGGGDDNGGGTQPPVAPATTSTISPP